MLAGDFVGLKVYKAPAKGTRPQRSGAPREPRRLGRIHHAVFSPEGTRVIGFMVKLPDVAGMIKQEDRFIPLSVIRAGEDGLVVPDEKASFDDAAASALGVDLERCLIWAGMDAVSSSGERVGIVADASFDPKSGAVEYFIITEGASSDVLVGHREMPAGDLIGYSDGCMVVRDSVLDLAFSGGAAAKAAEASVAVKRGVEKGAKALDEHGSRAVDAGSRALGKQLGKTRGMFKSFVSEYRKASGSPKKS